MKRRILYAFAFFLMTWAASSCEMENCKFCRTVSTDSSNGDVTEGFESEYCGVSLIAIEATAPKTVGTITTRWECR